MTDREGDRNSECKVEHEVKRKAELDVEGEGTGGCNCFEDQTIYAAFVKQARCNPGATAILDKGRSFTYAQLQAVVNMVAARLPEHPHCIGIVMDHGLEMVASILAVLKVGAAYVPAEPSFPRDRIRYMLTEANVDAVITQRGYDDLFQSATRVFVEPGELAQKLSDGEPATLMQEPAAADAANADRAFNDAAHPTDVAYVLYTSGTTGRPKGVMVEHRNVTSYIASFQHEFHLSQRDVMLQQSVCSFDIFVEEVFSALLNGAALAILPAELRGSTERLIAFINQMNVTVVDAFPYLLSDINAAAHVPQTVRLFISGGDVLRASYCDNLVKHALVYNTYGPSETTCCASYYCVNEGHALEDGTFPVGKAVLCDTVEVLDESLSPAKPGQLGEICIGGAGVSRGYLGNHPDQANFITREDGTRLYRSGDLGYELADGNLAFVRRKDSQIMIEGRRVECAEVENVIAADAAVHQVVVRPLKDDEDLSYMVAYVVPADPDIHARFDVKGLVSRISQKLADFMIPEYFVQMREIPLNANGKPDVGALPVVLKTKR